MMFLNKKGPKQLFLCACYFGMVISQVQTFPGTTAYRNPGEVVSTKNGLQTEPTCEELKAMWRFSKRQSRAAELTNELPMYRDPFADNIWEPFYATSRSIGGMRIGKGPIYGTVITNPLMKFQDPVLRDEMFKFITSLYHRPQIVEPSRPATQFRMHGAVPVIRYPPQSGSFNHLKELIKTERARELQQQRLAEESAARAASLKEAERNQPARYTTSDHYLYDVADPQEIMYSEDGGETEPEEEQETGKQTQGSGVISFPDLLSPASRSEGHVARFVPDYSDYSHYSPYTRRHVGRIRPHGPSLFDTSHFNDGYSGYIL